MSRIQHLCEWCAAVFMADLYELRRGKGRFCGKRCADRWQSEHKRVGDGAKARYNVKRRERRRDPETAKIERARDAVYRAKKRGDLVSQPCEACGDEIAEAHHEDYAKPLEVRWLCYRHHREADLVLGNRAI